MSEATESDNFSEASVESFNPRPNRLLADPSEAGNSNPSNPNNRDDANEGSESEDIIDIEGVFGVLSLQQGRDPNESDSVSEAEQQAKDEAIALLRRRVVTLEVSA